MAGVSALAVRDSPTDKGCDGERLRLEASGTSWSNSSEFLQLTEDDGVAEKLGSAIGLDLVIHGGCAILVLNYTLALQIRKDSDLNCNFSKNYGRLSLQPNNH